MKKILFLLSILAFNQIIFAKSKDQEIVQFNESYELANIILALTEYGKSDKLEVNKNTDYYQQVLTYFSPVSNHPLLEKVNYSREKWDTLLSFRTDAAAFSFDNDNKLYRKHKFYSMGKEINAFEKNIDLIQDFIVKSNYREFYSKQKPYFDSISQLYEESLMINKIEKFLIREFETNSKSNHRIIVSPLVGRMHCQRYFNKASTSFINIPDYLYDINNINQISDKDIASGLHMFFTEIDHDYVNPITKKYKKLHSVNFTTSKWDKNSGYGNWDRAVFNEYMTWAVYDIFILNSFPKVDKKVLLEWHEVNISRGFYASSLFSKKLVELYMNKEKEETICSLYPKLILYCKEVEDKLDTLLIE